MDPEPVTREGLVCVKGRTPAPCASATISGCSAAAEGHDLLDLSDRLPEEVQRRLERRMPPIPGMPHLFPPVGIRVALEVNRNPFVARRRLHGRPMRTPGPACRGWHWRR